MRLIEAASAEEEDSVQELWARLIANALQPDGTAVIRKVYLDLLKSFSPAETLLMDLLSFPVPARLTVGQAEPIYKKLESIAEAGWRRLPIEDRIVATQNLVRLRCVTFRPDRLDLHGLFRPVDHDPRQCTVDAFRFESLLRHLGEMIESASGLSEPTKGLYVSAPHHSSYPHVPEGNLLLTPLGQGLMHACRDQTQGWDEGLSA